MGKGMEEWCENECRMRIWDYTREDAIATWLRSHVASPIFIRLIVSNELPLPFPRIYCFGYIRLAPAICLKIICTSISPFLCITIRPFSFSPIISALQHFILHSFPDAGLGSGPDCYILCNILSVDRANLSSDYIANEEKGHSTVVECNSSTLRKSCTYARLNLISPFLS